MENSEKINDKDLIQKRGKESNNYRNFASINI